MTRLLRPAGEDDPVIRVVGDLGPGAFAHAGVVADFYEANVRGVTFRTESIVGFTSVRSTFSECEFIAMRFAERLPIFARVGQTVYRDCTFQGCNLERAHIGQARFERCLFEGNVIDEWFSFAGEFIDCTFIGKITGSKFCGRPVGPEEALTAVRESNDFSGNDFSRAQLDDVVFVNGIDIDAQRWPASPQYVRLYRLGERVERARPELAQLVDPKARNEARAVLEGLSMYAREGQTVFFARRTDIPFPSVREVIWRALEKDLPDN